MSEMVFLQPALEDMAAPANVGTDFVHLHVRSGFSMLYGPRDVRDLAKAAAGMGYRAMAITDIDNIHGVHAFAEACFEENIRPIFGMELRGAGGRRVVLLAKTGQGFSELCRLSTRRSREEIIDLATEIPGYSRDLVAMTDHGVLLKAWKGKIRDLYALVMPWSRAALPVARDLDIPLIASYEATFVEHGDRNTQRVLRAVAGLRPLAGVEETELTHPEALLRPPGDALADFRDLPDAVANTRKLAEEIPFAKIADGWIFPRWETAPGVRVEDVLREQIFEGALRRYGEIGEVVRTRIEHELAVIIPKGFADYFLVVADIVKHASRTCGRGSGAASIVSYCLFITNVDPIKYNLYFERFLNHGRQDPPDIDIDFAWDERDELIRTVIERYGAGRCARVANHVRFQYRSALREVARVYGIPDAETTAFERALRQPGNGPREYAPVWKEILAHAQRLHGLPRGMSVHSGGIVITPDCIDRYAPITKAPSATILGWEKEGTEAAGLVKIDLLGNRSLAVIRDALANLERQGVRIDTREWRPAEDSRTIKMLAEGDSIGVFYIESPAMRQLQAKTGVGDFEHIVIHSSIIRPAANRFINEYVRRLRAGPGSWEPLDPRIEAFLGESYGILCYQEDISKAAIAMAGFSDTDADKLRKVVSKKPYGRTLAAFKDKFFEGARATGTKEEVTTAVWEMIMSFDGYSFCKPHSASYAMVSFQSAYLKAHHGPEFMAAVLSNEGGFYTAQAYISETLRMGIRIDGPDVNKSGYRYHAEEGRVRVGLMALRGLSARIAEDMITERERGGPYADLRDFAARTRVARDEMRILVMAGALDSLGHGLLRPEILRSCAIYSADKRIRYPAVAEGVDGQGYAGGLYGQAEFFPVRDFGMPAYTGQGEPAGIRELLAYELRYLGYLIRYHPMTLWKQAIQKRERVKGHELRSYMGRRIVLAGWPVTRKEVSTKDKEPMEFFSFEDETAIYETVLFPKTYERYAHRLYELRPYWLYGRVEDDMGAVYLNVEQVEPVEDENGWVERERKGWGESGAAREIPGAGYYGYGAGEREFFAASTDT